jgi:hypothetical protein
MREYTKKKLRRFMPRITLVKKAQKNQGECGKCGMKVKKGDGYKWWKFRFGGRYVRCLKPECAPKPSDLTRSEFYGTLYGLEESLSSALDDFRKGGEPADLAGALNDLAEELRNLGSECQDKLDNMPEGLQQGDTGQLLENRAQECESKADELESAAGEIESVELYDDTAKYLEDNPIARGEDESDDSFNKRVKEEMEEGNEEARDETASNIEIDLSIE